ncbi:MAG: hypothetical protein SGPRY_001547 [Prymnesium sp.]
MVVQLGLLLAAFLPSPGGVARWPAPRASWQACMIAPPPTTTLPASTTPLPAISPSIRSKSGDELEAYWERGRGKPFRRSLRLWMFSLLTTWKALRARKNEHAEKAAAAWVRDQLLLLGPTMIKLGQVASSRTDLLPSAYTDALSVLQDAVPTISSERVKQLVEAELGKPVSSVFEEFDMTPLAGASLGQVHLAKYAGTPVAVKVQRLSLRELFDTDFFNIRLFARIANFFERRRKKKSGVGARDWLQYTEDAAKLLYLEIDYLNEARNAQKFAASLPSTSSILVPRVFDSATTTRLLTMEFVPSFKLTDKTKLAYHGLDGRALSKQVIDVFLMQLLTTGVLHCDPHPGNMCVDSSGRLVFYDFGMIDVLEEGVQEGLREAAFALFGGSSDPSPPELREAARQLMSALQRMGFVNKAADAMVLQKVCTFVVKNFKDEAAGRATEDITEKIGPELQSLVDDGLIEFPSIFTFIARAFSSVDGIGRSLDPKYEFRRLCEPYVSDIITQRYQKQAANAREGLLHGFRSVRVI